MDYDCYCSNSISTTVSAVENTYFAKADGYSISSSGISISSDCILNAKPNREVMPNNAKTLLYQDRKCLNVKIADKDGYVDKQKYLMSDIEDVSVVCNNGEKRVVKIKFADGQTEKAVLDADDTFSLEQGINVCIAKKLFSEIAGCEHGGSIYNKVIDRAVKKYNQKLKAEQKKAEEAAASKKKYQKLIEKKRNKRIKRENAARENQIEIQKEAYLRAMRELKNSENVAAD